MQVDIFCQVIDFYGDVAVSWRLALALKAQQPNWQICYFCDDWQVWHCLTGCPHLPQTYQGIQLKNYISSSYHIADVTLEMLACTLPPEYKPAPLVINVEYLTAEDWVLSCHLGQSYPLARYFFFPGFCAGTGGLTWGNFFTKKLPPCDILKARKHWCAQLGISCDVERYWVSCYAYNIDWAHVRIPAGTIMLGPQPLPQGQSVPPNCIFLPMTLDQYDTLLWLCDAHVVRGEESLSRAVLTEKPFVWQAYRQQDQAHQVKIQALVNQICPPDCAEHAYVHELFRLLNEQNILDENFLKPCPHTLAQCFVRVSCQVQAVGSLEKNLCQFILNKLL